LRTEEEYWIETRRLQELLGRVEYRGVKGVLEMLARREAVKKEQHWLAEKAEELETRRGKKKKKYWKMEELRDLAWGLEGSKYDDADWRGD